MHFDKDALGGLGSRIGGDYQRTTAARHGLDGAHFADPRGLQATSGATGTGLAGPARDLPHDHSEDVCVEEEPGQPNGTVEGVEHAKQPSRRPHEVVGGDHRRPGGQRAGHFRLGELAGQALHFAVDGTRPVRSVPAVAANAGCDQCAAAAHRQDERCC